MYRAFAYGALAMCVMGALVAAEQQPTFRGTSDAVRVFATVTDRDGRIVTTLSQNDFEVRDDGKPQPITLFDNSWGRRSEIRPGRRSESNPPEGRSFYADLARRQRDCRSFLFF
jgi:hypothetical protein